MTAVLTPVRPLGPCCPPDVRDSRDVGGVPDPGGVPDVGDAPGVGDAPRGEPCDALSDEEIGRGSPAATSTASPSPTGAGRASCTPWPPAPWATRARPRT